MQMPGSPVIRAQPSAECVPPSSWRTEMWRIEDPRSESYSGRIAAPGHAERDR